MEDARTVLAQKRATAARRVLPINPSAPGPNVPIPVIPGNINLLKRPQVRNADGSVSTVRSMSFGTDNGTVLLPTVVGNAVVSPDAAWNEYVKTGKNLGTFANDPQAEAYARWLHKQQSRFYGLG